MTAWYRVKRYFRNHYLLWKMEPLNLWLDDIREAPDGWYHAVTAEEAIDILRSNVVRNCSLDHDLGTTQTGYDVVMWLAYELMANGHNYFPVGDCRSHSANPPGKQNIESVLRRYHPRDKN